MSQALSPSSASQAAPVSSTFGENSFVGLYYLQMDSLPGQFFEKSVPLASYIFSANGYSWRSFYYDEGVSELS